MRMFIHICKMGITLTPCTRVDKRCMGSWQVAREMRTGEIQEAGS